VVLIVKEKIRQCLPGLALAALCLCGGCGFGGLAAVMGTPSYHEATVPAEFDLTEQKANRLLVLVEQPGWIDAKVNMRFYLTEAMDSSLAKYAEIPDPNLIGYDQLSAFREASPDFGQLSPTEIGSRIGADMVLKVHIDDLRLDEAGGPEFLKGKMDTQAVLLDVDSGLKLWPESEAAKKVNVGFEIEDRGWDMAVARLAAASAHCTTRYLYDCKKKRFRIFDDKTIVDVEDWEEKLFLEKDK
jgi:hypothetical protein